jgi:hypothetical protein
LESCVFAAVGIEVLVFGAEYFPLYQQSLVQTILRFAAVYLDERLLAV